MPFKFLHEHSTQVKHVSGTCICVAWTYDDFSTPTSDVGEMQVPGGSHTVRHASKRQRLSLLEVDDLFNPPSTSALFPALNPVTSHADATALSHHSLVAAYIDTIEVCGQQNQAGLFVWTSASLCARACKMSVVATLAELIVHVGIMT